MEVKEEIIFTVKPLYTKDKKSDCICCPKEHVFSYTYSKNIDEILHDFARETIRNSGDFYKEKNFRITIEEIVEKVSKLEEGN